MGIPKFSLQQLSTTTIIGCVPPCRLYFFTEGKRKKNKQAREKKLENSICRCAEQLRQAQKIKAEWHIRKASLPQCVSKAWRSHVAAQHLLLEVRPATPTCVTGGRTTTHVTHTGTSCQASSFAIINQRLLCYIVITTNNFQFYRWSLKAAVGYFIFWLSGPRFTVFRSLLAGFKQYELSQR